MNSLMSEHAEAHRERGNEHLQRGEIAPAIVAYQQALVVADDPVLQGTLYANLSLALLHAGQPAAAKEAACKSVSLRADWPKSNYRLGKALAALGRHGEAATAYCAALELAQDAKARNSLSRAIEECSARMGRPCPGCAQFALAWRASHCCDECAAVPGTHGECCEKRPLTAPSRRVVPAEPTRFPPSAAALRDHLLSEGFAVAANAVGEAELRELRSLLWDHLEGFGMRRDDPSTWGQAKEAGESLPASLSYPAPQT